MRAGKTREEVARHLDINESWYDDLERRDDELVSTLSLFQAIELAACLGVRLPQLLDSRTSPDSTIGLVKLPDVIRNHLVSNKLSLAQFEELVGWELEDFLKSPIKVAAEAPILFLRDLAGHLGMDWLSLVPEEHDP